MHVDALLPPLVTIALAVLAIGFVARRLGQPMIVAYLVAGVLLGPFVGGLIDDPAVLEKLGAIGVVLLLFFAGMEIDLRRLLDRWRVVVLGTILQIVLSVACVLAVGTALGWPLARSVLLGFVISLSSTAVVLKLLRENGETESAVGRDVTGILLVQDMALIPMLIVLGALDGGRFELGEVSLQLSGGILLVGLLFGIRKLDMARFPFRDLLEKDHEIQVFAALAICLGLALLSAAFHLSSALGAFVAGILVSATPATRWTHDSLQPFHVFFLGLFFVSVGMLVDFGFLWANLLPVSLLVGFVLITNTLLSAGILRLLGDTWRQSLYAGALLSQIGEFSFVLAAVGRSAKIITEVGYQFVVLTIALSLVVSTFWIAGVRRLTAVDAVGGEPGELPPAALEATGGVEQLPG